MNQNDFDSENAEEMLNREEENSGLDKMLEDHPEYLEEIEKRIRQEVEEARREWQKAEDEKISRIKAEAEKAAGMTEEERAIRAEMEKENQLTAREMELTRREIRLNAMEKLSQRHLPLALLDTLCFDDEEKCEASLNKVEAAFRAAVQAGVTGRMQGKAPVRCGATADLNNMTDEDYYKMTYSQGKKE